MLRSLKKLAAVGRMSVSAFWGLLQYRRNGHISKHIWNDLLWAHCASNGRTTELLNLITRITRPPRKRASADGLLGYFDVARQQDIVAALNRDGYYIFPELLPDDVCDEIQDFAANAQTIVETNRDLKSPLVRYDSSHPISRTYKIMEKDSIRNRGIQQIVADPVFVAIAESYLGTLPVIGRVDAWWSACYGNQPGSDAAQLFHFDFDAPPAWLKLFVYLTDVGPDNGPHVYVRESHKAGLVQAREFRSRGYERITDEEMAAMFGADKLVEIGGKRGTVFMADTRGFHKGKFPTEGHRLIAQVVYCSPIFNDYIDPPPPPVEQHPAFAAAVASSPAIYARYQ
ncbi:MAG TPA: phytanoyl-CoA dioxygenase family protein [Rhizomicrobium sp.]|nr:phytanoyl-CoA dioxygenase family protein [Rhizomicrobium sp.]